MSFGGYTPARVYNRQAGVKLDPGEVIVMPGDLKWWSIFEKTGGPSQTGNVEREQLSNVIKLLQVEVKQLDLLKVYAYLESFSGGRGVIELPDLVNFFECPLHPRDLIRCQMTMNLNRPQRFVRYRAFIIHRRPFNFELRAGPGRISAVFFSSSDEAMNNSLDRGSCLVNVNKARVEWSKFNDIAYTLKTIPCPFLLTFRNSDIGNDGESGWTDLTFKEKGMFCTVLPPPVEVIKNPYQFEHCKHCPRKDAWYLNGHRFMEDEEFSDIGRWTQISVFVLIVISIIVYVLQSDVRLEDWPGWQIFEGVISIIFTIEFTFRIAVCGNMCRYMMDFMNMVDFLAIIPFWIEIASQGQLEAGVMRIIRLIRLVRLVRLTKKNATIGIFTRTISLSITWLWTFFFLGSLMMMVFSSILSVIERGQPTDIRRCDALEAGSCLSTGIFDDIGNEISAVDCEISCESYTSDWEYACCSFEQVHGSCLFFDASLNSSGNGNAGLCRTYELYVRRGEDAQSPFASIPASLWFVVVSMMMVGYGEIYPIMELGRGVAIIGGVIGLMFMALIVIMISFNLRTEYRKLPDGSLKKSATFESGDVYRYLTSVNKELGAELFEKTDELSLIGSGNRLDSEKRIQQILRFNSWAYLPYAMDDRPGVPRLTQFKLFVLFSMFARRYQVLDHCSTRGRPEVPVYLLENDELL